NPTIYAYELIGVESHKGLVKVGYTNRTSHNRIAEQLKTSRVQYKILFEESAIRNDGTVFTDHAVHRFLRKKKIKNPEGEWFKCSLDEIRSAILSIKLGIIVDDSRSLNFKMRPEQEKAVNKTITYFKSFKKENRDKTPHFLWNAKMRFGKTFATYQLAKKMGWKKLLVLTFKPAVQSAWEEDLQTHIDFKGWQFISRNGLSFEEVDKNKPFVCFGSFQDYLGKNEVGGLKAKNEWVHTINWDCVVLDEYHYGAWRENAKDLFEAEDKKEVKFGEGEGIDFFDEETMPITTNAYLYLSGTPFRAIASGEFIEEQIFNWTYSDEQRAKEEWIRTEQGRSEGEINPYQSLPRMVMLTYQLPDSI
ncbi:MAG: GIY-YIG nuclease family protein, partial [Ignavibacteriaceae bacterium]|nr:GIY-YIG nuclease family protein [Ignavibacteriaceae bacterium]